MRESHGDFPGLEWPLLLAGSQHVILSCDYPHRPPPPWDCFRLWRKGWPPLLLVDMWTATTFLESNLDTSIRIKYTEYFWTPQSHSWEIHPIKTKASIYVYMNKMWQWDLRTKYVPPALGWLNKLWKIHSENIILEPLNGGSTTWFGRLFEMSFCKVNRESLHTHEDS